MPFLSTSCSRFSCINNVRKTLWFLVDGEIAGVRQSTTCSVGRTTAAVAGAAGRDAGNGRNGATGFGSRRDDDLVNYYKTLKSMAKTADAFTVASYGLPRNQESGARPPLAVKLQSTVYFQQSDHSCSPSLPSSNHSEFSVGLTLMRTMLLSRSTSSVSVLQRLSCTTFAA